jgi:acetyl-CoA acetyltransferase
VSLPGRGAVIVGAFNTRQARVLEGETSDSITLAAIKGALADAGLSITDVDGVNILPGLDFNNGSRTFAYALGLQFFWAGRAAPGPAAVVEAKRAIESGMCDTVVLASGQAAIHTDRGSVAPWTRPSNEFIECWGLHTPAEFALAAKEYMVRFGVKPDEVAYIAAVIRNNGARNPEAIYYGKGPFTADEILASRMVADPYHLLDCSMTGEGGSALVLTTAERARDLAGRAVSILGGARRIHTRPRTTAPECSAAAPAIERSPKPDSHVTTSTCSSSTTTSPGRSSATSRRCATARSVRVRRSSPTARSRSAGDTRS